MAVRLWCKVLVVLAALCVPVFSSSAESAAQPGLDETGSVYAVLRKWIAAETAIGIYRAWPDTAGSGALEASALQEAALLAIEETAEAVRDFKRGYQYYAYSLSSFSHEARVDDILSLLEDTANTIRAGKPLQPSYPEDTVQPADAVHTVDASYPLDTPHPVDAAHTVDAIRDALIAWQRYDTALMNSIQLNYVYQNGIFIITILALVCFLTLQLRKVQQADAKAERSAAFSRDIVLAQEQERQRIARELHDTIIPEIRRVGFLSQETKFQKPGFPEIENECNTLILNIREICQNLIPPDLNLLGLGESLKNLCIAFEAKSGIECRPIIPDNVSFGALSPDMQLQCYRLVQEALTNIEKHAKASEASVTLRNDRNTGKAALLIFVTDDGIGFNPSIAHANSYRHPALSASNETVPMGIRGMYDRMGILGGALSFQTGPGEGVMVRMEIPLT
ncbi:hypothetical protein AGMMS50267_07670 [Spirochaetia bacterium]|nr:hypothetical protein AGMMS50267_07620 [Spirochaetia bacterium]GHV88407.1 hypothetical protein AGMMS50267_07670 [Spirochaetia bacterium]